MYSMFKMTKLTNNYTFCENNNNNNKNNNVANIIHQELAIKCGLSEEKTQHRVINKAHSVLQNSNYKLYRDRAITT